MESYIAHPYWPAKDDVISIQKTSGMNRCRSEDKRAQALKGQLTKQGLTMDEYKALVVESQRPWYRLDDDDPDSEIVIPRHHLAGALVQTVLNVPKSVRGKFTADSFRHLVRLSDFSTEKSEHDTIFDRYVKLETSNQRSRQQNYVIEHFEATGTIEVIKDVKVEDFRRLLAVALEDTGVGAARKMGYGRGEVVSLG